VCATAILAALVLGSIGLGLGGKSRHQRVADLAAASSARAMRRDYPRLFQPAVLVSGAPNPDHLSRQAYLSRAREAAVRGARLNSGRLDRDEVTFPDGSSFAPVTVRVSLRGQVHIPAARVLGHDEDAVPVRVSATAELAPAPGAGPVGAPAYGTGGGYSGPLAYRMGRGMRPDVAHAFDAMAAAARREAGLSLSIASGFRSDAEQARLWAANPNPRWVAPPGTSLHRYATELDLGPPAAYGWLAANARRFGLIKRYAWEGWHFGFGANPRDVPAQYERGSWEPDGGDHGRIFHGLPSFVPSAFHDPIARAALRWNVPMSLLAAQLYAESNFNPFARSPAGAQGIAQFMPDTARAYGLRNPFDAERAIDAQAHMMSDLLRRFGTVAKALAAYNAGPGAVTRHGGIPPYAETRAYVARILGLLEGAGELAATPFEVRLVE
jgi:hypothetical protein